MNRKSCLYAIAIAAILLLVIGSPVGFQKLSGLRAGKNILQLTTYIAEDGLTTVDLKGLKADEIPVFNIHTIKDLSYLNPEHKTSIDFGALQDLATLNPIYRGASVSLTDQKGAEFKVLTPKSNKGVVAALINRTSLLVPVKTIKVKALSKSKAADFVPAISDFIVFMKDQNCYSALKEGDSLTAKCPEFIYEAPFNLEYSIDKKSLKIIPGGHPFWEQLQVYKSPIAFTYGKAANVSYGAKDKISGKMKVAISKAKIKTLGSFEYVGSQTTAMAIAQSEGSDSSPNSEGGGNSSPSPSSESGSVKSEDSSGSSSKACLTPEEIVYLKKLPEGNLKKALLTLGLCPSSEQSEGSDSSPSSEGAGNSSPSPSSESGSVQSEGSGSSTSSKGIGRETPTMEWFPDSSAPADPDSTSVVTEDGSTLTIGIKCDPKTVELRYRLAQYCSISLEVYNKIRAAAIANKTFTEEEIACMEPVEVMKELHWRETPVYKMSKCTCEVIGKILDVMSEVAVKAPPFCPPLGY